MAHKNHPVCEFTSKATCDKAARIAIGQCSAMIDEDRPCAHWGIGTVEDKPYCGQHLNGVFLAADKAKREIARKAEVDARIDAYMARRRDHPSVWDTA